MNFTTIKTIFAFLFVLLALGACSTTNTATDATATQALRTLAPQRVDIRGTITISRYDQGQVILEVEGFGPTNETRYSRAYVLVLPTLSILDPDGQSVSMNELRPGQNVAIMLRGGGSGNLTGIGVARRMWIEERL